MIQVSQVPETLRRGRLDHNLSIRDLAKKAGLSPTTVSLAEKGADIRISTLLNLCDVLDIEVRLHRGDG